MRLVEIPKTEPCADEIFNKVIFGGICHIEIDGIEGRIKMPQYQLILEHQIIGKFQKTAAHIGLFNFLFRWAFLLIDIQ